MLVDGDFYQVTGRRADIFFTGSQPVRPDHCDGWRREPYSVDRDYLEAARGLK